MVETGIAASRTPRRRQGRAAGWLRPLALIPVVGVAGFVLGAWPLVPVVVVSALVGSLAILVVAGTADRPNCG